MTIRRKSERGAVLIQVAVASLALLGISALAIDFGVKWVARGQAQNAADAGALAGAVALSFDNPNDLSDTGPAKLSARNYALANAVWGQAPDVDITTDVTFPPCPDGSPDTCVKVDAYRNQERGNPLPTYFARLVGRPNQGVLATATAQVRVGNAVNCLKPWAVVDRWNEFEGSHAEPDTPDQDFRPASTFDRYSSGQGNDPPQENDLYIPPSPSSPGTGWQVEADFGRQFAIKTGAPGNEAVSSGWFRELDLPRIDTGNLGGNAYGANIVSCNGYPTGIAAPETVCPAAGDINSFEEKVHWAELGCVRVQTGVIQGQTRDGLEDIYNLDPGARWNPAMNEGRGGIANSCCTPSPRIVPVAVMDIDQYLAADPTGSGGVVRLVNIFGFFIEGMGDLNPDGTISFNPTSPLDNNAKVVVGRIMTLPGLAMGGSTINQNAAFLRTILLVR